MVTITFTEKENLNLIREIIGIIDTNQKNKDQTQTTLTNNNTTNNNNAHNNDNNSDGRPTDKMIYYLDVNNIPYNKDTITFNQASNLISNHKSKQKQGGN